MVLCALIPGSPFTRSRLRMHFTTLTLATPGHNTCVKEVGGLFVNFCSTFLLMRHGCGVLSLLSEHVRTRSDNLKTLGP